MGIGGRGKSEKERRVSQPLVIHSDRGVQYTCGDYEESDGRDGTQLFVESLSMGQRLHRKLPFPDQERMDQPVPYHNYSHAYRLVFEYIEAFYNTVRIHSHCGYRSPGEYEKQYLARMEAKMKETG